MRVTTTQDYNGLPAGSTLQGVTVGPPGLYNGLWCSAGGSFQVSVPIEICREWSEDVSSFDHFYGGRTNS
jgi:hypothetical protein